ncbi:MAG: ribosomal protein S18-alanine N-acetyltransferase [candidate division Zixibacteria bacterium]|nr:ribosomal protein S18-alanine N-acetyltransferase [candidate division Zixibacteria bacterium]
MILKDLAEVAAMERDIFPDPWTEDMFREALTLNKSVNLVADDGDGSLCGYLCAQAVADEIQIHNVAVATTHRRQGIGRALLEYAEKQGGENGAVCAILEVRITNTAALAMYGQMGYRRIGRRRAYYRKPVCDALVLLKVFDGAPAEETKQDAT